MRIGTAIMFLLIMMILFGYLLSEGISKTGSVNPSAESIGVRLQSLSADLASTSHSIREIEGEIERTKILVDELEQKKTLYEQAITLDREQVEAIAYILGLQQEEQNRKSTWLNTGLGFLTNLVTAIISIYLEYKVGFFRRWLKKS